MSWCQQREKWLSRMLWKRREHQTGSNCPASPGSGFAKWRAAHGQSQTRRCTWDCSYGSSHTTPFSQHPSPCPFSVITMCIQKEKELVRVEKLFFSYCCGCVQREREREKERTESHLWREELATTYQHIHRYVLCVCCVCDSVRVGNSLPWWFALWCKTWIVAFQSLCGDQVSRGPLETPLVVNTCQTHDGTVWPTTSQRRGYKGHYKRGNGHRKSKKKGERGRWAHHATYSDLRSHLLHSYIIWFEVLTPLWWWCKRALEIPVD